jgi:hypothetical protein
LAALIAVGVVVWLHFLFLLHEIGVREQGVVDAFRGSWATVRGSRLEVGVLALLLTSMRTGVSWFSAPPVDGSWALLPAIATLVSLVASAAIGVVTVAILARAYHELRPGVDRTEPPRADSVDADSPQGEPNPR